jgi:hypothetical protein
MRIKPLLAIAWLAACPALAASEVWSTSAVDERLLRADPDSPVANLRYRSEGLSARAGVWLPLWGESDEDGWSARLPGLIELHNNGGLNLVPWQYWRGRVGLEVLRRWQAGSFHLSVVAGLDHESDHPTASPDADADAPLGYVYENGVVLRASAQLPLARQAVSAAASARLHVLTCTISPDVCGQLHGTVGDRSVEVQLDVVHDFPLRGAEADAWRWVNALHASLLVPAERVVAERRLILASGVAVRSVRKGLFQVRAELMLGNKVGYSRAKEGLSLGLGIAWSP